MSAPERINVSDRSSTCAVCQNEIVPADAKIITRCNHLFHDICLNDWLLQHKTCPLCRLANDVRSYATVSILGKQHTGLLDSGASLTVIGGDFAKEIMQTPDLPTYSSAVVRTADGQRQKILGVVNTKISFMNQVRLMDVFVIPSLTQDLYLGIDFFNAFGLFNPIFKLPTITITESIVSELPMDNQQRLQNAIQLLPSFSKMGLGLPLRAPMISPMKTERLGQRLYIDILGPYPRSKAGNIAILVILDHVTKYPFLFPLRKLTAEPICQLLATNVFYAFGCPEVIVSDNGTQFKSKLFEDFLAKHGVKHTLLALYSPQANASERVNRSVLSGIRSYLKEEHLKWDLHLSKIACALRCSLHQTLKCSPYYAAFGLTMVTHGSSYKLLRRLNSLHEPGETILRPDYLNKICIRILDLTAEAFVKSAKRYNLRARVSLFIPGDTVFRRNFILSDAGKKLSAKLSQKFVEARVIRLVGGTAYELEDLVFKRRGVYHSRDIRA